MAEHLVLYSTNTWLAYQISKEFYGGLHYVWCSPYFSSKSVPGYQYTNPPSSSPSDIYDRLYEDVKRGDLHSPKISSNIVGIRNGATKMADAGLIKKQAKKDIYSITKQAQIQFFRPLLYIIPFPLAINLIKAVPIGMRANPLSSEYVIEQLPQDCFDVIEYRV